MSPTSKLTSYVTSACSVYCEGSLLRTVQLSNLFNDSKYFVDMPMKRDPDVILQDFEYLTGNHTSLDDELLGAFIENNFFEAGADLLPWDPPDFNSKPAFISKLTFAPYRDWAYSINDLWKDLGKIVNISWVDENPSRHSFLPRRHGMVVPGGRFRESYYWDSYFTILGLLSCNMPNTTRNVIDNLLDDVANFGFVPNGGRIYYLDRSQPPLLSDMVVKYYDFMMTSSSSSGGGNTSMETVLYLNSSFFLLNSEYNWWMNPKNGHVVNITDPIDSSKSYILNRYFSNMTTPRPESFYVDYYNGYFNGRFPDINTNSEEFHFDDDSYDSHPETSSPFFHSIRAAAESGWDFSSRWINSHFALDADLDSIFESYEGEFNLTGIDTVSIIPVDLNSIMYRFESNMANIAKILDRELPNYVGTGSLSYNYLADAELFGLRAKNRKEAINSVLWDDSNSKWADYNTSARSLSTITSLSSWSAPLWAGIYPETMLEKDRIVSSLVNSKLIRKHGLLTTTVMTGQQWDSPNAWPPLVLMTIQGLSQLGTTKSKELSSSITSIWLDTCYNAHKDTGFMFEKYNAFEGTGGGGGEYVPQRGFGWTNGVALFLLSSTVTSTDSGEEFYDDVDFWSSLEGIFVIIVIIFTVILTTYSGLKYCLDVNRINSGNNNNTYNFNSNGSNNYESNNRSKNRSKFGAITEPLMRAAYDPLSTIAEDDCTSDTETVDNNLHASYRSKERRNNDSNDISMKEI